MIKKIKVNYPPMGGIATITLPKFMTIETGIWGDKTIEIENIGDEIIIRKCEPELSESVKLARLFAGTDLMRKPAKRRNKNGN